MIIIFTIEQDISSSEVIKLLNSYNQEVIRINSDDDIFKFYEISSKGIFFQNTKTNKLYNILEAKSCWWRRNGLSKKNFINKNLSKPIIINDIDLTSIIKGNNSILIEESKDLRNYIFNKVYNNCSINLGNQNFNLNKLIVLEMAKNNDLLIPEFQIFSNKEQIQYQIGEKDYITKSIANGVYTVIKNNSFYSYTEKIESSILNTKTNFFPSLAMEMIDKKFEIRTFYLDGYFFSMAIFSQSSDKTKIDFRKYNSIKPNKTEPYKLPKEIEIKLENLFRQLNLNTGSVDLIVDNNDNFIFLEINPVGQYGMVSIPCNYNLDNIIAKYLINGTVEIN